MKVKLIFILALFLLISLVKAEDATDDDESKTKFCDGIY